MSPQKEDMTTKQVLEQHMEDEGNPWILESPTKTSKTGSSSTSIATSMDTWQKNTEWKRRNEKHEHVSNATRRGILPKEQTKFWRRSQVGTVQEISHVNSQNNKYIILNRQTSEGKKELNVQANVKTKNGKKLKVKALVDSGCTYTGIDKQLVKDKRIQTKLINFSFEVFNADGTKNGEVTKVVPLEIEINGHKEILEAAVTDLDRMDMFLRYDWLVKHNLEVNWKNGTIKFTRCRTMKHKDIRFKSRRIKAMETTDNKKQDNGEIGKELDKTNTEDLPEYI